METIWQAKVWTEQGQEPKLYYFSSKADLLTSIWKTTWKQAEVFTDISEPFLSPVTVKDKKFGHILLEAKPIERPVILTGPVQF